jgi:hypothetical protein
MMIKFFNTMVAISAMRGKRRSINIACGAESELIKPWLVNVNVLNFSLYIFLGGFDLQSFNIFMP